MGDILKTQNNSILIKNTYCNKQIKMSWNTLNNNMD